MARFHFAEPGTNPMDLQQQDKKNRAGKIRIILAVLGLVLVCGLPAFFLVRSAAAKKTPAVAQTMTSSPTPSSTASPTGTAQPDPSQTASPTPSSTASAEPISSPTRPGATQTPWIITQVATKLVSVPGQPYPVVTVHVITVVVPVVHTQVVTTTPEATQTPWIITQEVTRIVEVTPTPTETPSPTPTSTEIPTGLGQNPVETPVESPVAN